MHRLTLPHLPDVGPLSRILSGLQQFEANFVEMCYNISVFSHIAFYRGFCSTLMGNAQLSKGAHIGAEVVDPAIWMICI